MTHVTMNVGPKKVNRLRDVILTAAVMKEVVRNRCAIYATVTVQK